MYQPTGTACVGWGEVFQFVDETAIQSVGEAMLKLECSGKGLFAPCYGHIVVPLSKFVAPASSSSHLVVDVNDIPILTHSLGLGTGTGATSGESGGAVSTTMSNFFSAFSISSGTSGGTASASSGVAIGPSVRIMTMRVPGGSDELVTKAMTRLTAKAKQAITDTLQVSDCLNGKLTGRMTG